MELHFPAACEQSADFASLALYLKGGLNPQLRFHECEITHPIPSHCDKVASVGCVIAILNNNVDHKIFVTVNNGVQVPAQDPRKTLRASKLCIPSVPRYPLF